ncbi:DUF222 domain-containing protein, partial [Kribbella sp. NPDC026596]|uniref:DUF222 domain-containing protein n=1 Tax=Kribbella sp. NPDC026596 TaxID=3155122 RepID=UPI0033CE60BD
MFERDLSTLSTADLLESAAEHRAEANRAEARLLEHAQVFADRNHPDGRRPRRRTADGRERSIVLGGDGCPAIAEFAPAEFGLVLGISSAAAAGYIGRALALRHRFPRIWAKVQDGTATPWRACKIAAACESLSEESAASIDKRLARCVDTVTPQRLENIVKAAQAHADPAAARAKAEQRSRERGVYLGRSDDHGTKTIYIRTATGNALRHDATIAGIADALKIFGDTRSVQTRRAEAVGIIADPRYTEELLAQAREHLLNNPQVAQAEAPGVDRTTLRRRPSDHARQSDASNADPDVPQAGGAARCGPDGDHAAVRVGDSDDDELLNDGTSGEGTDPGANDEADRDAPHPSECDLPDPLDIPSAEPTESFDPGLCFDPDDGEPLDTNAARALHVRLAQIKHDAHTGPKPHDGGHHGSRDPDAGRAGVCPTTRSGTSAGEGRRSGRLRPGQTEIYVHLTDHTLATGTGVLRAETIGPLLASQLAELIGYGPYTVKPVIDLNDAVSVDAYEIPDRIRERIKLTHPVEL